MVLFVLNQGTWLVSGTEGNVLEPRRNHGTSTLNQIWEKISLTVLRAGCVGIAFIFSGK